MPDPELVALHRQLINRFGLPWTIDRLGPRDYAIVAKVGRFFDPLGYQRRPVLDPCLAPNSPEMVARANSDRVRTIQAYWDQARRDHAKRRAV